MIARTPSLNASSRLVFICAGLMVRCAAMEANSLTVKGQVLRVSPHAILTHFVYRVLRTLVFRTGRAPIILAKIGVSGQLKSFYIVRLQFEGASKFFKGIFVVPFSEIVRLPGRSAPPGLIRKSPIANVWVYGPLPSAAAGVTQTVPFSTSTRTRLAPDSFASMN